MKIVTNQRLNVSFRRVAGWMLTIGAMIACVPQATAVTDKEMDEARAITAKAYLRYANDGSGYLDEINVKSMGELTGKLKDKEKENLKAFQSVSVPKDYASWDKAKLVEFWSVTFFTSPALTDKGKAAKSRVRKQIQAMSVSAPQAAEEKAEPTAPAPAAAPSAPSDTTIMTEATGAAAMEQQQEILADQQDIQAANEESGAKDGNEGTGTWIYVVVLIILVGVVVWLMVYAANLMKKQPGGDKVTEADNEELRDKARTALVKKNDEIAELQKRLHDEEERSASTGAMLEKMRLENKRLLKQIEQLKTENTRLSSLQQAPEPPKMAHIAREEAATPAAPVSVDAAPKESAPAKQPKTIYLGRANSRGIFVRADRRVSPGNTIFRLDTSDGLVGTFRVVDSEEVFDTALSNPKEYLVGGCSGEDLEDTAGVSEIITESAGTAIFEKGYWKVLRKTKIRYE